MTNSSFIYEQGDAIEVGSHGDHNFVFADGDQVADGGGSTLTFEAGTGLGVRDVHTVTVYRESDSKQLAQVVGRDTGTGYDSGGVGYYKRGQNGTSSMRLYVDAVDDDGTTIDDVEDGEIAEYSLSIGRGTDASGYFRATTDEVYEGQYAIELDHSDKTGVNLGMTSLPGDGLNTYPKRGTTITYYIYQKEGERTDQLWYGAQDHVTLGDNKPDEAYRVQIDDRNTGGELVVSSYGISFDDDSAEMDVTNNKGQWLRVEVEWGV